MMNAECGYTFSDGKNSIEAEVTNWCVIISAFDGRPVGQEITLPFAEVARLRDWLNSALARPDDADETVTQLGCDLGPCSAKCVAGKACFPAASDDHDDAWQMGYRQGRFDAQAEAATPPNDDELTTAQELRVWAVEMASREYVRETPAELVAYVLDGTASA